MKENEGSIRRQSNRQRIIPSGITLLEYIYARFVDLGIYSNVNKYKEINKEREADNISGGEKMGEKIYHSRKEMPNH